MPRITITILYDDHLGRFFYLERGNPAGSQRCHRTDTVQWQTGGDLAATVDFGTGETPFQVSRVEVPRHGPSDPQDVIGRDGRYKYLVTLETGAQDDPEIVIDPDDA